MKLSAAVFACSFLLISHTLADSVTLNSGDVIQGEILSETDTQIVLKVSNSNRTIVTRQLIPKSDIKTIERDSPQQRQEREAYEALDKFQLDPNSELVKTQYEGGMEAFNGYLATYPNSRFLADVQQRLSLWSNEQSHVEQGEVKFNNQWMTPDEKKLRAGLAWIEDLRRRVRDLQKRRDDVLKDISDTKTAIAQCQRTIARPPRRYTGDVLLPGRRGGPPVIARGRYEVDTAAQNRAKQDLAANQTQLNKLTQSMATMEKAIDITSRNLAELEATYNAVSTRQQQPLQPLPTTVDKPPPTVAAETPTSRSAVVAQQPTIVTQQEAVASPPPSSPAAAGNSWFEKNWKWLVGAVAFLVVFGYLVRRYTTNRIIQQLADESERQRDEELARRREEEFASKTAEQDNPPRE